MRLICAIPIVLIACAGLVQAQQQQSLESAMKELREIQIKMPPREQSDDLIAELKPKKDAEKIWGKKIEKFLE